MSQEKDIEEFYNIADKFINLANELNKTDTSGRVGSALRYAAARYSAYEASLVTKDMAAEKEEIKKSLMKDYDMMLDENLDAYIRHLASLSAQK